MTSIAGSSLAGGLSGAKKMNAIKINRRVNNLKIISKLMDTVAKRYQCRVRYNAAENCLRFEGDPETRRHIIEQSVAYFSGRR